jgi:hypothetical protein
MAFLDYFRSLKRPEHRLAWTIAIAADALQIAAMPLFAAGGISPADTLLDLLVAFLLTRVLGWHWAFLPSLLAELVPCRRCVEVRRGRCRPRRGTRFLFQRYLPH